LDVFIVLSVILALLTSRRLVVLRRVALTTVPSVMVETSASNETDCRSR